MTTERRASFALLTACALWGLSFPVMKTLNLAGVAADPGVSGLFVSAVMVALRFVAAAIVVVAFRPGVPTRAELTQGVLLGVVTGAGMLLQTDGLNYTQASTSAFLTQGYVVLLPLVSFAVTGRPPTLRVASCALLVLAGLTVLARFDFRALSMGRGELETLAAATCFTAQILLLDVPAFRSHRAPTVTAVMFFVIGVVVFPIIVGTGPGLHDVVRVVSPRASLPMIAVIVALPTLVSFGLMNGFQRHVTPSEAGIIYASEPVFASAMSLVLPAWLSRFAGVDYANESVDARLVLGGTLVVVANVLLALSPARTTAPVP